MPRDLADVLHYFMPDAAQEEYALPAATGSAETATSPLQPDSRPGEERDSLLPLAAVPIADHEIVRASLTVSLATEIAALGGDATILTPETPNSARLFPPGACDAPRVRVQTTRADNLAALHEAAVELAARRGAGENEGGIVLVRIPTPWLSGAEPTPELLEWLLLFTSTDHRNLSQTFALATRVLRENPTAEIGITVHGARERRDAEDAFGLLARSVEQRLGLTLASYGLLVEDLDIYRAIVAGRSVARAHPGSLAAQALREVANFVFERARKANLH